MEKKFFVYILASGRNGTLYIGVTSDLPKRVYAEAAITSEKRLKAWKRNWKLEMIERMNPYWRDLYDDITS